MRTFVRSRRTLLGILIGLATLALSAGVAYAVFPDDNVTHYAGCLNTAGSAGKQ